MEINWYVIHTYSGYENKVKANLEKRMESMNVTDKIFRIMVPMEDEVEFKDGQRKINHKKMFPGYVLVEMMMTGPRRVRAGHQRRQRKSQSHGQHVWPGNHGRTGLRPGPEDRVVRFWRLRSLGYPFRVGEPRGPSDPGRRRAAV